MPNGWLKPSRKVSRVSATPSRLVSRSSVMRFGLTPTAAARFMVLTMAWSNSDFGLPGQEQRLGDGDVAVGQHVDPARMLEAGWRRR